MGVAAIPIIGALAGTAIQAYNTNRTAKKQDAILAQGIREKAAKQRQMDARIGDVVQNLSQSTAAPEQASTLASYQDALRGTDQQAAAGQTLSGLSKAYDEATSAGTARANASVNRVANALSKIDAAGLQRQREGFGVGDLSTDLRVLARDAEGSDFLTRLRADAVRRNPWLDALGAAAKGYGSVAGGNIDWNNLGSWGGV